MHLYAHHCKIQDKRTACFQKTGLRAVCCDKEVEAHEAHAGLVSDACMPCRLRGRRARKIRRHAGHLRRHRGGGRTRDRRGERLRLQGIPDHHQPGRERRAARHRGRLRPRVQPRPAARPAQAGQARQRAEHQHRLLPHGRKVPEHAHHRARELRGAAAFHGLHHPHLGSGDGPPRDPGRPV